MGRGACWHCSVLYDVWSNGHDENAFSGRHARLGQVRLITTSPLPRMALEYAHASCSPWAASVRRSALARCAVDANAVSDAAGVPRCDLLDQPRITVGIIEGEERPVARALGVGAGKPCL